jgi:endonuclease YncB( thermonuclease family)
MRSGLFCALVGAVHFALIPHLVFSESEPPIEGFVVAAPEGDAITVQVHRERVSVRLSDIDAPELNQPYGRESRESLAALALGRNVRCVARGRDRFGRPASRCKLKDLDVSEEQVRRGMAWFFARYRNDELLQRLEDEARVAKRGLWTDGRAVPPWTWSSL